MELQVVATKRKTQLMKLNVFITIIALAISLTSLFYVTYSWFIFQRRADTLGPKISIDEGLAYNLKYFTYNLDGGYPKAGHEPVNVVSTSYATDFVNVAETFHEDYSLIEEPGYRVTFALEITSFPSGSDHNVTFTMTSFDAPPHEEFFRYDGTNVHDIHLSEAINIYTATMVVSATDNDTTKTAFVNNFISSNTLTDRFNYSYNDMPAEDEFIALGTSPDVSASEDDTMVIFFFTIEFSNTSDTFYKYHSIINMETVYFTKDTTGNSNVFKGLSFIINEIMVRKEYIA